MKSGKINKIKLLNTIVKSVVVLFLLIFFIAKPLIIRGLEDSENSLELCEENEKNSEENESETEIDIFDDFLFETFLLQNLCLITNKRFDCFISQYVNRFIPIIITPPPELV